jgi:hypothetical protein
MTIVSLAFSCINGIWYPTFARPCKHCSKLIMKYEINNVSYSDYQGNLVKIKTDILINETTYSTGYKLHYGVGEHIITININDIEIFGGINEGYINVYPCFRRDLMIGMKINFMISIEDGKRFMCTKVITGLRRYRNMQNLIKKENFYKILHKKIDENGIIAIRF